MEIGKRLNNMKDIQKENMVAVTENHSESTRVQGDTAKALKLMALGNMSTSLLLLLVINIYLMSTETIYCQSDKAPNCRCTQNNACII